MEPELDSELGRLFERNAARDLPRDAFLNDIRRKVVAIQAGRRLARTFARFLVIVLVALASPWLIGASELLSGSLETLFADLADFLGRPIGIGLVAFGVAVAYVYLRRRNPRFWH